MQSDNEIIKNALKKYAVQCQFFKHPKLAERCNTIAERFQESVIPINLSDKLVYFGLPLTFVPAPISLMMMFDYFTPSDNWRLFELIGFVGTNVNGRPK